MPVMLRYVPGLDQVNGPGEVLVRVLLRQLVFVPVLFAPRRIAAQGQDVADAEHLGLLEGFVDEGAVHVGACQVQTCGEAQLALAYLSQLEGLLRRGAASAPCDGDKERAQGLRHALETALEVGETLHSCQHCSVRLTFALQEVCACCLWGVP